MIPSYKPQAMEFCQNFKFLDFELQYGGGDNNRDFGNILRGHPQQQSVQDPIFMIHTSDRV